MIITEEKTRIPFKNSVKKDFQFRLVTATIILVLVITCLPYLYAYLTAPPDKQFMGIMVNVPDHGQYFSWMRELSQKYLAENKLTPEPNKPVFFNLLWWGMGRLGRLLGFSQAGMFQILRVVSTTLFLLLAYRICAWYFQDRLMCLTSFLLVTFAGGFGWILILIKYVLRIPDTPLPLLVYISEPNTFFNILAFPHFIAAALYIFVFDLVLRGQAKQQLRYAVTAGMVALFLGWQHAYDLILVYGILGSYVALTFLRDRQLPIYLIKSCLIIGFISWWPALYSVLLTKLDPLWKEVLAQFANAGVFTPNPFLLPILLGPTFILAVFTVIKNGLFRLKDFDNKSLFLTTWFLANFLLIYIPTDYQIHMLNGFQVPIALLATQGIFYYVIPFIQNVVRRKHLVWSKEAIQRSVIIAVILIAVPTNVYIFLWRFVDLARHDYPYYLYRDEVAALNWLKKNTDPEDVVLSSYTVGHYIPAISGNKAFLAHWAQTVDFYDKRGRVSHFFNPSILDDERVETLSKFGVDYVYHGPGERKIGSYNPKTAPWLALVFSLPLVDIYRIKDDMLVSKMYSHN